MRIAISRYVLIGIQQISADSEGREACGLLFGSDALVDGFQVVENVHEAPDRHFEIDPAALFAALRAERAGGPGIIGYWHSHPSGDPMPSITDAAMAAPDGRLWLIQGGDTITAWRAVERGALHGRFDRVTVEPA
jgi:desampylase